jgi:hypothetical protein
VGSKQQLRFAAFAFLAGLAWGYLRHRASPQRITHGVLQGVEWFIAYGGAAALVEALRVALEARDEAAEPSEERVTHLHQVMAERTGTDG